MNVLVSFEIKFKTNREKLIDLLKHFAFKRIQEYANPAMKKPVHLAGT